MMRGVWSCQASGCQPPLHRSRLDGPLMGALIELGRCPIAKVGTELPGVSQTSFKFCEWGLALGSSWAAFRGGVRFALRYCMWGVGTVSDWTGSCAVTASCLRFCVRLPTILG